MKSDLSKSITEICSKKFLTKYWTNIYLDPIQKRLYSYPCLGTTPSAAHHNIDQKVLRVSPRAILSSVESYLRSIEDKLTEILDEFQGTEWDGNNHVGVWSQKSEQLIADLQMESDCSEDIATFWSPDEWFDAVLDKIQKLWEEGLGIEEIVDTLGCGDELNGCCDRDEAIAWLGDLLEEWKEMERRAWEEKW